LGSIRASAGAGNGGKCSESCFLVFLQEWECRKWGPKGRENWEKRKSLKENATKLIDIEQVLTHFVVRVDACSSVFALLISLTMK